MSESNNNGDNKGEVERKEGHFTTAPPTPSSAAAKDDAQPPTAAGNGAATDSNNKMKGKQALENIKIPDQELTAAGDQAQSDPQSSLSPRNYGQMQPTELLLLSPETESAEVFNFSQKDRAVAKITANLSSTPPPSPPPPASSEVDGEPVETEPESVQQTATPPEMDDKPEYCNLQGEEDAGEGNCVEEEKKICNGDLEKPSSAPDEKETLTFESTEPDSSGEILSSEKPLQTEVTFDDVVVVSPETESSPQLTHRQKGAREDILDRMLEDALEKDSDEQREKHKATCCSSCLNSCCQSKTCSLSSILCIGRNRSKEGTKEPPLLTMTDTLLKGRAEGLKDFKKAIFPLVPEMVRLLWVIFEVILVITGLVLSIVTLSLDENRIFTIIHFALIVLSTLLALIDAIFTFKNSTITKRLWSKCGGNVQGEARIAQDGGEGEGEEDDKTCCQKCYSRCNNLFDILRLFLSEAIFYPLLICDIFELIVGRGFEGRSATDIIGIFLFSISLLLMVVTVYVARIVVLVAMVKNATAVRTPEPKKVQEDGNRKEDDSVYDPTIRQSAMCYQAAFCVHVVMQMLAQLFMYIAIAAKIRYDNRHVYRQGSEDDTLRISGNLGYMLFAGYVMPFLGLFTFFIVTYYWSQQYPIGYRIDMMSIFKMTEYGMMDVMKMRETIREKGKKMRKNLKDGEKKKAVLDFVAGLKPLKSDFYELFNKSLSDKFLYPFKTPGLVIICLIYALLQLAFVLCAAQTVNEMGEIVTHILNGGGWVIYYIVAVVVGVIANIYTFLIAGFWVLIIAVIIAAIALIVAYLILLCLCVTEDQSRRFCND